jgi:hypothetical protein
VEAEPDGAGADCVSAARRDKIELPLSALSGCSGSTTFSGLALEIATPQRLPGSPSVGPFDNPGFGYASGTSQGPNFISLTGAFTSTDTAIGVTIFTDFLGCGNGLATWNATRRR